MPHEALDQGKRRRPKESIAHPGLVGGEENPPVVIATERDNGRWLLRWSPYYYKATNGKEITLSNHNGIWFGDDDKIKGIYTFYDRNELSKMYDEEDPLETVE